jgi:hypothetical protein
MSSSPSTPTPLRTAQTVSGQITLRWKYPSNGAAVETYKITCDGVTPHVISGSLTKYVVTGLDDMNMYAFSIVAVNANGESPAANFDQVQPACDTNGFI